MTSRSSKIYSGSRHNPRELRLGYVPLSHAAPLFAAKQLGFFAEQGLAVRLVREIGWATVREKIATGELDAAQAPGPMPLAMSLGIGSHRVSCVSSLITNANGNAVVVSRRLWEAFGGRHGALRQGRRPLADAITLAVVYPHSAHQFILRRWCEEAGLVPDRDFRLVVIPPPQVVTHLRAGHIDGCCVGEPWATLAVRSGTGIIDALSADLAPGHPEKVLITRERFAEERHAEHLGLLRALAKAAAWCADPAHHEELIDLLAHRDHLALSRDILRPAITGHLDLGAGRTDSRPDALAFHGHNVNDPTPATAQWLARQLGVTVPDDFLARVYRRDLYLAAIQPEPVPPSPTPTPHELAPCLS
ncbi:MAG: ABC transporter substrate-binding protein [Verrucomicrobiales bacterium]|nr:ABC transporter substrate-binding protein [Verrucomicrobiales bacterium]